MQMIDSIPETMIAPCGVNCIACSAYLSDKNPCAGCCAPNEMSTLKSCRNCVKKRCCLEKSLQWCFQCEKFPCTKIKDLNRRYMQNYDVNIVQNGLDARKDMQVFLKEQKERFICNLCVGIINQHHKICSECGKPID